MVCKKALLVLAGSPPSVEILRWWVEETDCSIAVDGGWRCFAEAGLLPEVLIGDADSFPSFEKVADKETKVSVHRIIDQETTDFEKALDWLDSRTSPEEIVILGGLGGRSDHLCTNLMIASRIDPQRLVVFDGHEEWIRRITPECPLSLRGRKGATDLGQPLSGQSKETLRVLRRRKRRHKAAIIPVGAFWEEGLLHAHPPVGDSRAPPVSIPLSLDAIHGLTDSE